MSDSNRAQGFLTKRNRSLIERLVALILLPFALLYRLIMDVRRFLYRSGVCKTVRLPVRVISVGGITIGGSGKTPVVIHLARYLESAGKRTVILTRGYGGQSHAVAVIRPDDSGSRVSMSDEVRLMSERTPAVIGVGSNRVAAFNEASRSVKFDAAILDDGFQHLRIKRDLDIVTVDSTAPFGNGLMLPAGNLREPRSSLGRADVLLLTRVSQSGCAEGDLRMLKRRFRDKMVITAKYVSDGVQEVYTGEMTSPEMLQEGRVFAFSAIANPESFFSTLERAGFTVAGRRAFRDHHIFTQADIDSLTAKALEAGCGVFMVTEKDAVKLRSLDRSHIAVYAYRIRLEFITGEDSLYGAMERLFDDKA